MRWCVPLLLFGGLFLFALTPDEQQTHIAKLRGYGQSYRSTLHDFICTKTVTRTVDTSGSGKRWKLLETEEQEVTYAGFHETDTLLKVNGSSKNPRAKKGFTRVSLEFSVLASLFNPKATVELEFDHAADGLCITRYRTSRFSAAALTFDAGRSHESIPHSGFLYAECDTGRVTRLQLTTDEGPEGESWLRSDISFAPVNIGATQFMLPDSATNEAHHRQSVTRLQVKFSDYRKYDAKSSIQFDTNN